VNPLFTKHVYAHFPLKSAKSSRLKLAIFRSETAILSFSRNLPSQALVSKVRQHWSKRSCFVVRHVSRLPQTLGGTSDVSPYMGAITRQGTKSVRSWDMWHSSFHNRRARRSEIGVSCLGILYLRIAEAWCKVSLGWGNYQSCCFCCHPDPKITSKKSQTFKPRRNIPEGTKQYQLKKYAEATLGSGNLKLAVALPEGEDLNEWLAVNSKWAPQRVIGYF